MSWTATLCCTALMSVSLRMHTGHIALRYGLMGPNLIMGQEIFDPDIWHRRGQNIGNARITESQFAVDSSSWEKSIWKPLKIGKRKSPQSLVHPLYSPSPSHVFCLVMLANGLHMDREPNRAFCSPCTLRGSQAFGTHFFVKLCF